MSRTLLRNMALFTWLLVVCAQQAFAQPYVLDQLTTFRQPANIMVGAIAKLPDGRIYGFYSGGYKGGIYQAIPNGTGGYTAQVAYEFTATSPGLPGQFLLNGVASKAVEAGADGRVYFASADGLARFDPNANTVERLHAFTSEFPVSLTIGIDGVTLFGGGGQGALFSYNSLTGDYRDIGNAGDGLVTVVQMKDGNLLIMNEELQNQRVVYKKTDPSTGVELAAVIFDRSSAIVPVRGDDGDIYGSNNVFGDKTIFRLNAGCFCFTALKTWLYPNAPFIFSLAGSRAGQIYFSSENVVQRLNTTVDPPIVELVTNKYDWNLQMMNDGTLMMFNGEHADGLNTASFTPGTDTSYQVAQQMVFDGVEGLPSFVTEGADGMLYGVAGQTYARYASIFRIDPVTRTHTLVQHLDLGADLNPNGYGSYTSRLILAPDHKLYGTFINNTTLDNGIFSYDPATNVAAIVRLFPIDPSIGYPGPEGGFPENLVMGSDGWIYGDLAFGGDLVTYNSALFKLDPNSGSLVSLYASSDPSGFYVGGPMVETAPGVWTGSYSNNDGTFCNILFGLDANTATFTSLTGLVYEVDGCGPSIARAPDGTIFVATSFGGPGVYGAINTFNPATNVVTPLKAFDSSTGTGGPRQLWIGADGELYGQLTRVNGVTKPAFFRFDRTTNQPVILAQVTTAPGSFSSTTFLGHDGRFYALTNNPSAAIAIGTIEKLPVAAASGPFGGTTSVSATLKAVGVPIGGETIAFTLNGHAIGSATTNSSGVATLNNVSLNGIAIGVFANAISASFAGDDRFPAVSGSGALTVVDVPTPGLMIGEGVIRDDEAKYEFGFLVRERANGADRGGFVLNVTQALRLRQGFGATGKPAKPREDRFVARSFTNVVFSDDPSIRPGRRPRPQVDTVLFAGNGEWNGQSGYRFEAFAQDKGEPGRHRESLRVVVYNAAGQVVVSFDDELSGGNIQSVRLRR